VISTRVGGLPEAVFDGETGLLVEPGDASALARAIVRYYREGLEAGFRSGIGRFVEQFGCEEESRNIEHFFSVSGQGT
jgi:glycosyltransferase involved in cell wall biosynthesis